VGVFVVMAVLVTVPVSLGMRVLVSALVLAMMSPIVPVRMIVPVFLLSFVRHFLNSFSEFCPFYFCLFTFYLSWPFLP